MNRKDAAQLVAIVVTAYPNYDKFKDAESVKATVNLWAVMFEDVAAGLVAMAVRKHIATSKWPPSVAELREILLEVAHPELIAPDVAWLAVSDLLYSEGEYLHRDLYKALPPLVARAVESIGWGNLYEMHRSYCHRGKPGMDRVAFMQQYTPMYEREKARNMTPEALTAQIDTAAAALPDNGQKLIGERERERRKKEDFYHDLAYGHMNAMIAAADRLALEAGESEQ